MRKIVLRSIVLALVLMLMLPLAACGGDDGANDAGTTSDAQNTESPANDAQDGDGATASTDEESDNPKSTELFQIEESFMKTQQRNNVMSYLNVDGEEREVLLAVVEALKPDVDLSTAIGEVTGFLVQAPGDGGASNNVVIFSLGTEEEYNKLREYYKTFGGEIVFESDTNMIVDFDWGKLNTCRYSPEFGQMVISFAID